MKLLTLLKGENSHITVVGDDDQSIYSWRGANLDNILNFKNLFDNVKIIKLEQKPVIEKTEKGYRIKK